MEQNKKFIIGDHRGNIQSFYYNTGEEYRPLVGHTSEISSFKIDNANKLIVSAGWDSRVIIQSQSKNGFEIKREIINCFNSKEIVLMELSVYHNMIATAGHCPEVYFWHYESCKLLGVLRLPSNAEPTLL